MQAVLRLSFRPPAISFGKSPLPLYPFLLHQAVRIHVASEPVET